MGCGDSRPKPIPINTYTVNYCALTEIKKNVYKIISIVKEEIPLKKERKFFDQLGKNHDQDIIDFLQNKKFEQNTIFYIYSSSSPQIKNCNQMYNLIPNNIRNLQSIFLLSTDIARKFPSFFIERKTMNLNISKFIGYEINLNDTVNILSGMNDINISNDEINYEDDLVEGEQGERRDEIYINGIINENYAENVKDYFLKNEEIIKVYISEIKIQDKNNFAELITFFWDQDIKIFSVYDTNINDADSIIFYSIIEILENNYNIRSLDLRNCNLNDNNLAVLKRAISDKRLRYLDLSKNGLTVDGAAILSQILSLNKTLLKLNISNNSSSFFKSEGIEYITQALIPHPNIKYIDFSGMNITGYGEFIEELIKENKSLESLILKNNTLNANDFKFIFNEIKSNKIIKVLDISYNDMGGKTSLECIRNAIKQNESLIELSIDKININNDNYNIIFEGIENNKKISKYSISYNQINIKIVFDFFIRQTQVKNVKYITDDKKKEFTLEEKKLMEKCKNERPDLNIIIH